MQAYPSGVQRSAMRSSPQVRMQSARQPGPSSPAALPAHMLSHSLEHEASACADGCTPKPMAHTNTTAARICLNMHRLRFGLTRGHHNVGSLPNVLSHLKDGRCHALHGDVSAIPGGNENHWHNSLAHCELARGDQRPRKVHVWTEAHHIPERRDAVIQAAGRNVGRDTNHSEAKKQKFVANSWDFIFDHEVSPLRHIPSLATRHMILQILGWMWALAFAVAAGSYALLPASLIGHAVLIGAAAITTATYATAAYRPETFKALGRRQDGEHE